MSKSFFDNVIAPVLAADASFIGITTWSANINNFVNRLVDLKYPSGESVFNSVKLDQVCERCKELGIGADCTHKMNEIPPWQNQQRHKDLKLILGDNEEAYLRETKGVQVNSGYLQIFETNDIKNFRNRMFNAGTAHKVVYTAVDPNAGGRGSKFAVVSCVFYDGKMVVRERERERERGFFSERSDTCVTRETTREKATIESIQSLFYSFCLLYKLFCTYYPDPVIYCQLDLLCRVLELVVENDCLLLVLCQKPP